MPQGSCYIPPCSGVTDFFVYSLVPQPVPVRCVNGSKSGTCMPGISNFTTHLHHSSLDLPASVHADHRQRACAHSSCHLIVEHRDFPPLCVEPDIRHSESMQSADLHLVDVIYRLLFVYASSYYAHFKLPALDTWSYSVHVEPFTVFASIYSAHFHAFPLSTFPFSPLIISSFCSFSHDTVPRRSI